MSKRKIGEVKVTVFLVHPSDDDGIEHTLAYIRTGRKDGLLSKVFEDGEVYLAMHELSMAVSNYALRQKEADTPD